MQFIFLVRTILAPPLSLSLPSCLSLALFCRSSVSLSLALTLHPLQSARGGVSPRAKHMLLSIALIQMQRGGIIARVAVASQGLCPSLAPFSQAHAISINALSLSLFSLSLCLSASLYQTPDLLSNQTSALFTHKATHPLKGSFCSPLILSLTSLLFVLLSDRHIGDTDFLGGDRTAQYVSKPLFHFIFLFPINATYQVFFVFVQ